MLCLVMMMTKAFVHDGVVFVKAIRCFLEMIVMEDFVRGSYDA